MGFTWLVLSEMESGTGFEVGGVDYGSVYLRHPRYGLGVEFSVAHVDELSEITLAESRRVLGGVELARKGDGNNL